MPRAANTQVKSSIPGYNRGRTTVLSEAEQQAVVDRVQARKDESTHIKRKLKPKKTVCKVVFNPNTAQFEVDDSKLKIANGIPMFQEVKAMIKANPKFNEPAILGLKRPTMKEYKRQKKEFMKTLPVSNDQKAARAKFFAMVAKNGGKNLKDRTGTGNMQRYNYKSLVASKAAKERREKKEAERRARGPRPKPAYVPESQRYGSDFAKKYITQRYRGYDEDDDE